MNLTTIWLVVFVACIAIEIITMGLTTIWFAGGALVGFFLSLAGVVPTVQWAVFCAVSLVLLFATRPWAVRHFNSQKKEKTNVDSLIGKTAVVTAEVSNLEGKAVAYAKDQTWKARTTEDTAVIPVDARVLVKAVEGVKLIVEEKKED